MSSANSLSLKDEYRTFLYETSRTRPIQVVDVIGGHGPWQFRQWIVFFAASLCNSVVLFAALFYPIHIYCSSDGPNANAENRTETSPVVEWLIENNKSAAWTVCNTSVCNATNISQDAEIPHADETQCWNPSYQIFMKCIYVVACFLSQLVVFFATMRFSRRHIYAVCCLFLVVPSAGVAWTHNAPFFLVMRFVISLSAVSIYIISSFALMEYVHKDYKIFYFLAGHLGWNSAHFILPLLSWLADGWLSFNLALKFLFIAFSLLVWWSPESPSSHPSRIQETRTMKALKLAAYTNGHSTSNVDLLFRLRREKKNDEEACAESKRKYLTVLYVLFFFTVSFCTSFLYFSCKWHPVWLRVDSGRLHFSFLGTVEVAVSIVLIFLSCIVCIKHLWACVSASGSVMILVIYVLNRQVSSTSSALLYTITSFFVSAAWTLMLAKSFCHPHKKRIDKLSLMTTGLALFTGALAASASVLKDTNRDMLLTWGIFNLVASAFIPLMPDDFFGSISTPSL